MLRSLVAAVSALALASGAVAQSQRTCISEAENRAVMAFLMPPLVTALAERCAPLLGGGAFLPGAAPELSARLAPLADRSWPAARAAVERVGGQPIPAEGRAGEMARRLGGPALAQGMARGFDADACRATDRLLAELAPLPPQNLSGVMALFLELGVAERADVPFRVCRAG